MSTSKPLCVLCVANSFAFLHLCCVYKNHTGESLQISSHLNIFTSGSHCNPCSIWNKLLLVHISSHPSRFICVLYPPLGSHSLGFAVSLHPSTQLTDWIKII